MKFHFISSVIFSVLLALMALNGNIKIRMLYMAGVLVLFYVTLISFALDYDAQRRKQWREKEKKVSEEVYQKFVKRHRKSRPKRKHK
ncbi:TPA: hypothetical protein HA239_00035 [Candidatus Woesearchaeota archaeon]|nr:hypothetical protein QT06_C0001G1163 [archaeon GW2011_AR15]MBS3104367.1 hypothetical protein [Candidatus Woesearchaeota archaeon]HIH40787.1 hypothetical protein [Candidatus Woesearchaeota archaeon]